MEKPEIKINKALIAIVLIGIMILVVVALFLPSYLDSRKKAKDGYYNDIAWGVSHEDLEQKLPEDALDSTDKMEFLHKVDDYEGLTGIDGMEVYHYEDGFSKVSVLVTIKDGSEYSAESAVDAFKDIYDKRYGKHDSTTFSYIWNTKKTRITLLKFSDNMLSIEYADSSR